jgi:hypothetical protein
MTAPNVYRIPPLARSTVPETPEASMICGRATIPTQPRKRPAPTGTQRGASSQINRWMMANAAPIQTTPSIENCQTPLRTRRP